MSYDAWKLRAPEDEPGYDAGQPEIAGVKCGQCGHFIADASGEEAWEHNGRWLCVDCFNEQPAVVAALSDIASRGDYE